ncbi:amylovoran biosynthesis glycosyltransferase AmsD [Bathymodiolus japonicus methanotrophic gill symbiont]|uniref:glycosyltransferase family 4 protein n=1 Tax=Bathymodiolus japonicus methanotrophic gill symbiont TaxID=113269 RepID=UPI001B48550F|nr:glycosyltransferase family 4 protein [Bathymodiolus japonicus methanotrophic gill symbiont]GFO72505.1 amylovoran biosynthesis glycosyltransferase AmsD [Bathymodiolus japonicus methanotrophic gill symbiont]
MRLILFIHSLSSGGAERASTNLANYWADKGWHITLVTMTGCEQDFYQLHPDIQRIALCLDAESSGLLTAIQSNVQRTKALRNVLKQQQPDVALAIMTTANILLALAARGLNITVIGSERIHPPMLPLGRAWEWLRKRSYRHLDAVTALTEETALWLKAETFAQYVPIIPNAVTYPIAIHSPRVSPNIAKGENFKLIAVGRLSPQKGFNRLLSAFAVLASRFPDWSLIILGEGSCRNSLEKQRAELMLEQRVLFPGAVGNLGEWYETADLYVMSSLFEGFPNTLVEAMAYGLPVVSVDCDTGPRDIIHDKVDGLLVPQNNHQALVEALAVLMSDKILRQQYAAQAIEIRDRLSMQKIAGMWEGLFFDVC